MVQPASTSMPDMQVSVRNVAFPAFSQLRNVTIMAMNTTVEKARAISGPDALVGAACASDAFYPFPDAVEACLQAGISAFVQPGGSVRDADVVAVADSAGASMLMTGIRHFRH